MNLAIIKARSSSTALSAVQAFPKHETVALEAITTYEEAFKFVHPSVRNEPGFQKRAVLANPILMMPEYQDPYARVALESVLSTAKREALAKDPDVKAEVAKLKARFAAVPDLSPAILPNRRLMATLINNRLADDPNDKRPVAVVTYPQEDQNGQFFSATNQINGLTGHYRVMFYQVGTDQEFVEAVKSGTKKAPATLVFVGGHGEPSLTALGADDPAKLPEALRAKLYSANAADRDEAMRALAEVDEGKYLDFSDTDILKGLKARLAKGADFVLMSCSTGKGGNGNSKNLANYLHKLFPQTRMHAPTEAVANSFVDVDAQGKFVRAGFANIGKAYVVEPSGR